MFTFKVKNCNCSCHENMVRKAVKKIGGVELVSINLLNGYERIGGYASSLSLPPPPPSAPVLPRQAAYGHPVTELPTAPAPLPYYYYGSSTSSDDHPKDHPCTIV
ncbi:hypothetical protein L1987_78850 [Smallanthus sonchifolius]|uniref:Uncharacterized protein n=1 Tax=Smallanthus sonchifolius TaxID=185202 RepID=A0ACB8ZE05_9ASTR|nr:hypothetical protein L1987_78850 [Smallanthus sonchifolius]